MGKIKNLFFLFVAALFLTSCSDSDEVVKTKVVESALDYFDITYDGVVYKNVPTGYDANGDFVFFDEDFSKVYSENLANNNGWSLAVKGDNEITFYDNLDENFKDNEINIVKAVSLDDASAKDVKTRAGYYDSYAELTLYDDRDFKDRHYPFTLADTTYYEVKDLKSKPWKFNDKCSSLIIDNKLPNDASQSIKLGNFTYPCSNVDAVFIGYDDKNFSDRTITGVAHAAEIRKHASLPGFNDKLSSFKFFLAPIGKYGSSI